MNKDDWVKKWWPWMLGVAVMPRPFHEGAAVGGKFINDAAEDLKKRMEEMFKDAQQAAANGQAQPATQQQPQRTGR